VQIKTDITKNGALFKKNYHNHVNLIGLHQDKVLTNENDFI